MSIPEATHAAIVTLLNTVPARIDWHYLRLYSHDRCPGALVTRRRHTAPRVSLSDEFLDPASYRVRVPSRKGFVGRRRVLQQCLRALRDPSGNKNGVVLAGMGGLGKSSTAARLLDRLKDRCRTAVWIGLLDETSLLSKLIPFTADQAASLALQQIAEPLDRRLGRLFDAMPPEDKRFLFIFDDFEQNFEKDAEGRPLLSPEGQPRLLPAAAQTLESLMRAVRAVPHSSPPWLIFTSRYKIPGTFMRHCEQIDLPDMDEADLRKFTESKGLDDAKRAEPAYQKAMTLAAGNPRLLEWLLAVLDQPGVTPGRLLQHLEKEVAAFRESVLADYLVECLPPEARQALKKLCLFRLPVPLSALAPLLPAGIELPAALDSAVALGLIETETDAFGLPGRHYRAHALLYDRDDSPPTEEVATAARALFSVWVDDESKGLDTPRMEELLRLALSGSVGAIAAYSASALGHRLFNSGQFREALHCCEAALPLCPGDFRLLHALARAEVLLGETARARTHYETALAACPREHREYAALLHNLAYLYLMQGEVERAMGLYQKSLGIYESLGDKQGKGATLFEMAK
ncbi:MAG TPA: tetratricopeptide repeat protein, partial [Saprospiraceae bacterium]|nr:tetratricopeptide repeat protein [Saprospiraceae bacterium]